MELFLKETSKLKDVMMVLLKDLMTMQGINARYIHCDHSGENKVFDRLCKPEQLNIKFECTVPAMPEQNGRTEEKQATS